MRTIRIKAQALFANREGGVSSLEDRLWEAVRKLKRCNLDQLCREAGASSDAASEWLVRMERYGALEFWEEDSFGRRQVATTLVRDEGIETPRVTRSGQPDREDGITARIWRVMNVLESFTVHEIATWSGVAKGAARRRIRIFRRAGYLKAHVESRSWRGMVQPNPPRFSLIAEYKGPFTPVIQHVPQLWDPNLKRVTWRGSNETADPLPIVCPHINEAMELHECVSIAYGTKRTRFGGDDYLCHSGWRRACQTCPQRPQPRDMNSWDVDVRLTVDGRPVNIVKRYA